MLITSTGSELASTGVDSSVRLRKLKTALLVQTAELSLFWCSVVSFCQNLSKYLSFYRVSSRDTIILIVVLDIYPRGYLMNIIKKLGRVEYFWISECVWGSVTKLQNLKDARRFWCFAPIQRNSIQGDFGVDPFGCTVFFVPSFQGNFFASSNHDFDNWVGKSLDVFNFDHVYDSLTIHFHLIHLKNLLKFFLLLGISFQYFLNLKRLKICDEEIVIGLILFKLNKFFIFLKPTLLFQLLILDFADLHLLNHDLR